MSVLYQSVVVLEFQVTSSSGRFKDMVCLPMHGEEKVTWGYI